jgi:hypothetical protein
MKHLLALFTLVVLVVALVGLSGCQKDQPLSITGPTGSPSSLGLTPPSWAQSFGIFEGTPQNPAGTAYFWHDGTNMYVKFVATAPYSFNAVGFSFGLAVFTQPNSGISSNCYQSSTQTEWTIPLSNVSLASGSGTGYACNSGSLSPGQTIYILIHAALNNGTGLGCEFNNDNTRRQPQCDWTLPALYNITGSIAVYDCEGLPFEGLGGYSITLDGNANTSTESDGSYLIEGLSNGTYDVCAVLSIPSLTSGGSQLDTTICVSVTINGSNVTADPIELQTADTRACEQSEGCDLTYCGFSKGGYKQVNNNGGGAPYQMLVANWSSVGPINNWPQSSNGTLINLTTPNHVSLQMPPHTTGGQAINARQQALAMYLNVALAGPLGSDLTMGTDVSAFGIVGCSGTIGDLIDAAKGGNTAAGGCLSKIIELIHAPGCLTVHYDICPE